MSKTRNHRAFAASLSMMICSVANTAGAQENASSELLLELNRIEQIGQSCRAIFVAENGLGADLAETAFELVLFDKAGLVSKMSVFDFGKLPAGRTVVRRFDLADMGCADISRILVNGAARCKGEGMAASDCTTSLKTENRTETRFGN